MNEKQILESEEDSTLIGKQITTDDTNKQRDRYQPSPPPSVTNNVKKNQNLELSWLSADASFKRTAYIYIMSIIFMILIIIIFFIVVTQQTDSKSKSNYFYSVIKQHMFEINELNKKFFEQKNDNIQKFHHLENSVIEEGLSSMAKQSGERFSSLGKDLESRLQKQMQQLRTNEAKFEEEVAKNKNEIEKKLSELKIRQFSSEDKLAKIQKQFVSNSKQISQQTQAQLLQIKKISQQQQKPSQKKYRKTVQNLENAGNQLGRQPKYFVNISQLLGKVDLSYQSAASCYSNETIYELNSFDFNRLISKNTIDFDKLRRQLFESLAYEIYYFKQSKNPKPGILKLEFLQKTEQATEYMSTFDNVNSGLSDVINIDLQLSIELAKNFENKKAYEAQYLRAESKFDISEKHEIGMCIFSFSRNLATKNQFQQYFQFMDKVNYTNYKVAFIDDASPDNSAEIVYNFIQNEDFKFKHKVRLIKHLQQIGRTASMALWIPQLCADDDVVVIIDGDDAIAGAQTLKILSSVYQKDTNLAYVYSQYLQKSPIYGFEKGEVFQELGQDTSVLRRNLIYDVPALKTFRAELFKKVPLFQFLEYHYDSQTGLGWPFFPQSSADYIQLWSQFELAGNQRIKHLSDSFMYCDLRTSTVTNKCQQIKQQFDLYKNSLKTPLKKLDSLRDAPMQVQGDLIPQALFDKSVNISSRAFSCARKS